MCLVMPARGDNQLMLLEPGEKITPADDVAKDRMAADLIIDALGKRGEDEDEEDRGGEIEISFAQNASDFIEADLRQNRALGIGVT